MRLEKLAVRNFQCIESAELELGPGLNVLYGPNDLGKSSLAWAIRAVLLLQHDSTQHERFVSWYGGGEPKVVLTFQDGDHRYWRVTKVFGSSGGRSELETSKDGRSFTVEARARQVDERVRNMLGWGLSAPGGKGPRGIPDAFLVQVLLADQDSVRNVFDASLIRDPDESGRVRLTQVLGALAQDPLFKKILTRAQRKNDLAFTPTGRAKRSATSPFVEIDERIKRLKRDHEEVATKVRQTELADARIRQLVAVRDDLSEELAAAKRELAALEQRHAKQRRRDELRAAIAQHRTTIEGAAASVARIAETQAQLTSLMEGLEIGATQVHQAEELAQLRESVREGLRARLDAMAQADDPRERVLEDARRVAEDAVRAAARDLERAADDLRRAKAIIPLFAQAVATAGVAREKARTAEEARTTAVDSVARAQASLAEAERRVREATNHDKAQVRELRRGALENRILQRRTEHGELAAAAERLAKVKQLTELAGAARRAAEDAGVAHAALESEHARLVACERLGRAQAIRAAIASASRAGEEARALRERASQLRDEARSLAAAGSPVPSKEDVARLRKLHDELRFAEAKLAVGLSVVIRPRRPIAVHSSLDGAPAIAAAIAGATTFDAVRTIALQVDDVLDLEVSAGEASARDRARELRVAWEVEGATYLRTHGAATLEALDDLRTAAETRRREAADRSREAEIAEERAAQLAQVAAGAAEQVAQLAHLEAELGTDDGGARARDLARLGADWKASLRQALAAIESKRSESAAAREAARHTLARLETQLETAEAAVAGAVIAADELGVREMIGHCEQDLAALERELAALAAGASEEEFAARAARDRAASELTSATQELEQRTRAATEERDGAVQAATRLGEARERAREVDAGAVWTDALSSGAPLAVDAWQRAHDDAEQAHAAARTRAQVAVGALATLASERTTELQRGRDDVEKATADARSARATAGELATRHAQTNEAIAQLRVTLAELKAEAAQANPGAAREALGLLESQLDDLGPAESIEPAALDVLRAAVVRHEGDHREAEHELAKARGALEEVGGSTVRERQRELEQAIAVAEVKEREVRTEYDAWKLLVDTMKIAEADAGAHLGPALSKIVSQRFRELTGGRYGEIELDPHLRSSGIDAAGGVRELDLLSTGTRDQLATLLRVCVAEQLRTSIVLDDHLSHSDPDRAAWFNSALREAAKQVQIVLLTCRPSELLATGELPAGDGSARSTAAGSLRAIDLARVIQRFGRAQLV
ncbi:MAG: AAA family ATPase [Deltaproteobacteria bacterium]|nr:AAA family ATPase [Deltaproteobacteria bacterium]